jgi:hypothetical protein
MEESEKIKILILDDEKQLTEELSGFFRAQIINHLKPIRQKKQIKYY